MRVLVTGAGGQLGSALLAQWPDGDDLVGADHARLPVEDAQRVHAVITHEAPDLIVHCAAWTDVDGCETDPTRARTVNHAGTANIVAAARSVGAHVMYVSTDYVFDGRHGDYSESDATGPVNVYGASKLAGEAPVLAAGGLVARPSVVWSPTSRNFVTWMADELREGRPIRIVDDQIVSPTCTTDLAMQLWNLRDQTGIWHTAGADAVGRLDMARAVADHVGADGGLITAISSNDLAWVAERPANSSLCVDKIRPVCEPMPFHESLLTLGA